MRESYAPRPLENPPRYVALRPGIIWGLVGGLIGTVVMDLFGLVVLLIAGGPDTISFSLIGDAAAAFFANLGVVIPGGTPLGALLHYLIGALLGVTFGAGISVLRIGALDWKKGAALGIVFVEAMSLPMLTAAAIVLQMTASKTLLYFGTSIVMHLVFGSVLGLCAYWGMHVAGTHRNPRAAPMRAGPPG